MKFKALATSAALAALFTLPAHSAMYVSGGLVNGDVDITLPGEADYSTDPGVGINVALGVEGQLSEKFALAGELEYIHFGEGTYYLADYTVSSFNLNLKPKYYFTPNWFAAATIGFGTMYAEISLPGVSGEGDDSAINYGAELGYAFDFGLQISGGIRQHSAEIDGIDHEVNSFLVQVGYHF